MTRSFSSQHLPSNLCACTKVNSKHRDRINTKRNKPFTESYIVRLGQETEVMQCKNHKKQQRRRLGRQLHKDTSVSECWERQQVRSGQTRRLHSYHLITSCCIKTLMWILEKVTFLFCHKSNKYLLWYSSHYYVLELFSFKYICGKSNLTSNCILPRSAKVITIQAAEEWWKPQSNLTATEL